MTTEHSKMSDRINSDRAEDFLDSQHLLDIKTDFAGRLVTIIVAALGLITALAWDRTLEDIFTHFFGPLTSLSRKITYTVVITIFAVAITILLRRFFIIKEQVRKRVDHLRRHR
ncbi:MAG: DUF5654 family protein [bacterium]